MTEKQLTPDGSTRIAIIASIPEILREYGVNPVEVLRLAGIPADVFDDPDNLISFNDRAHLLKLCADHTGCSHFGLLVGEHSGLSSFGLIGYLMKNAADVESAIKSLVRYFHLHAQGSLALFEVEQESAFLGYDIYQSQVEAKEQLLDAAVAVVLNILYELCGPNFEPTEICFSHRSPINQEPVGKFFNAPLRFDAHHSGIFFPARWLKQPVQGADSELHRLLKKQVKQLEHKYRDDFPGQVRRVLHMALLTGQVSSKHIAAIFSIHSRTLHRRLKSHGTSFQEMVDDCRFSIAKLMLEESDMSHAQIAEMLGYSDTRPFSRAFRRWSGVTASQWRADKGV